MFSLEHRGLLLMTTKKMFVVLIADLAVGPVAEASCLAAAT